MRLIWTEFLLPPLCSSFSCLTPTKLPSDLVFLIYFSMCSLSLCKTYTDFCILTFFCYLVYMLVSSMNFMLWSLNTFTIKTYIVNVIDFSFLFNIFVLVHQRKWLIFFFIMSLSTFGMRLILVLQNKLGDFISLSILWNCFKKITGLGI